jgi:hypothetical protein
VRFMSLYISLALAGCSGSVGNGVDTGSMNSKSADMTNHGTAQENETAPLIVIHRVGEVVYQAQLNKNNVFGGIRHITIVYTVFEEDVKGDYLRHLAENEGEFGQLVTYCSFEVEKDFQIEDGQGIKYECLSSVFERTYGLKQGATFNLAFEVPAGATDLVLKYNDRLAGNGPVRVSIL